jgi:hypothetical protein
MKVEKTKEVFNMQEQPKPQEQNPKQKKHSNFSIMLKQFMREILEEEKRNRSTK